MFIDFSNLTMSDKVQLMSIYVALLFGIISIIISVVALIQNSIVIKKSNMAQIEIFPFKIYGDIVPRIKIQNFGRTTANITDVIVHTELPQDNISNPFLFYKGLSIAPNQSYVMLFTCQNKPEPPVSEFDVTITYETLGKSIKQNYHINYNFLNCYDETSTNIKNVPQELNKINQSIQGLLQK